MREGMVNHSELMRLVFVCSFVFNLLFVVTEEWVTPSRQHGGIVMGVSNDFCDNAKWSLELDWDDSKDYEYTCQPYEDPISTRKTKPLISCLRNEEIPLPIHHCMNETIEYDDEPPRGGPHRPLWPVYGEYLYIPPQRWVHSMEHGGVVFLYHPCADQEEVKILKEIARRCLRRRIVTPYRKLSLHQPFAVLTYGCKLTMSRVNVATVVNFILENAFNPKRSSEAQVWRNGQFSHALLEEAKVITGSDEEDSQLCIGISALK